MPCVSFTGAVTIAIITSPLVSPLQHHTSVSSDGTMTVSSYYTLKVPVVRNTAPMRELMAIVDSALPKPKKHAAIISFLLHPDHRHLAMQRFPGGDRILEWLVVDGASLQTFKTFCEAFPEVMVQSLEDALRIEGYLHPLHMACTGSFARHLEKGTIAYMARQCPEAVRLSRYGIFPIYRLLQSGEEGFSPHLQDVKTLVEIFPEGLATQVHRGFRDVYAFDNALQCSPKVMKYIFSNLPKSVEEYSASSQDPWSLDQARALSLLVPQLKSLEVELEGSVPGAFPLMMKSLQRNRTIRNLTIRVPNRFLNANEKDRNALEQLLTHNKNFHSLSLYIHPGIRRKMRTDGPLYYIERGMATHLRENEHLQWLTIGGMDVDMKTLAEALVGNEHLKRLHLEGCKVSNWSCLADVLERKNVTLGEVYETKRRSVYPDNDMQKIQYFTHLNRVGRKDLRDPSIQLEKFVSLLENVTPFPEKTNDPATTHWRQAFQFGLLLEVPGLWSSIAMCGSTTAARRKRKRDDLG
jgi:hypothetical protein